MKPKINILICGNGGHYFELNRLYSYFMKEKYIYSDNFVVFTSSEFTQIPCNHIKFKDIRDKNSVLYTVLLFPYFTGYNFFKFLIFCRKYNVNSIISTGPGISVIPIILGKIFFRCKIIHVETMCKFTDLTISGKFIKPFSHLFIVQNLELKNKYDKSVIYGGRL